MVALQAPFGVQVLILRPAPGAHISTGPPRIDRRRIPFKGGVGGSEKLKAYASSQSAKGSYAVCGCSCAHAVLHNNRRTTSSDAKTGRRFFFVVWMVALQAPFGVQVLILRPAPGAHISTARRTQPHQAPAHPTTQ